MFPGCFLIKLVIIGVIAAVIAIGYIVFVQPRIEAVGGTIDFETSSEVIGYRADGTADVLVRVESQSDDGDDVEDLTIRLTCNEMGELDECARRIERRPASLGHFVVNAPMDAEIWAHVDESEPELVATVPQRIIGVDKSTWECYSDRLTDREWGEKYLDGIAHRNTCGGWDVPLELKRVKDVRVKVDERSDDYYIKAFDSALKEVASIFGLDVAYVDDDDEANLYAYLGVPVSETDRNDIRECANEPTAVGCAWSYWNDDYEITTSDLAIWSDRIESHGYYAEGAISSLMKHELFHAMAAIGHTDDRTSIMHKISVVEPSPMDLAMVELHAHPLVQPGMSMEELREQIVLTEELLDN